MMRLPLVALVALVGGCTIGGGTTTVGIWRPKRTIDTTVCIQHEPDKCDRVVEVTRDHPARTFGGGMLSWANPGYARITGNGSAQSAFALNNYVEYLRGRGGLGLGLRVGANIAVIGDQLLYSFPLTVVGHLGWERLSFYGGLGYTPVARVTEQPENEMDAATTVLSTHGPNALVGSRFILRPGSIGITVSFEVMHQMMFDLDATSATASLGLHL